MAGDEAFLSALVLHTVIAVVGIVVYCVLRLKHPKVFAPRTLLVTTPGREPLAPSPGFLGWVSAAMRQTDEEIFQRVGLDALMVIKFFRWAMLAFGLASLYGLIVLVPIYTQGKAKATAIINKLSLSNIENGDSAMWATLVGMYVVNVVALYLLKSLYGEWVAFRVRFLRNQSLVQNRSVLVRDLPPECQTSAALLAEFQKHYPDAVAAEVAQDVDALRKKLLERRKAQWALEHTLGVIRAKPEKERPTKRVGAKFLCIGGQKVDAEKAWNDELADLEPEVDRLLKEAEQSPSPYPAGVVTFASLASANAAAQLEHSPQPLRFEAQRAPEPRDMFFPNLRHGFFSRFVRSILIGLATFMLVIFWIIPVAAVAALTSLDALSKQVTFLEDVVDVSPVLRGILEGILPVLAYIIFFAILPPVLALFTRLEGVPSESQVTQGQLSKLFIFKMVNAYLLTLVATSAFTALDDLINDPSSIFSLLGESVPASGVYFLVLVMAQSMSSWGLRLLRIGPLIVSKIKLKWLAKTEREAEMAWRPKPFEFGKLLPDDLLVVVIGISYSTIAPVVLPFCALYFALGWLVNREQFMFVHLSEFDTGGLFWPLIFKRILSSIILGQITAIGVLGVKEFKYTPLLLPLLIATILFSRYLRKAYEQVPQHLPRQECTADSGSDKDADGVELGEVTMAPSAEQGAYKQPELSRRLRDDVLRDFHGAQGPAAAAAPATSDMPSERPATAESGVDALQPASDGAGQHHAKFQDV